MHSNTKTKILETVIDIIKNDPRGQNWTLSNIAKRVGIAKSTIYEYFSSKQELTYEATMFLLNRYQEQFLSLKIENLSFIEALKQNINHTIETLQEAKSLFQFMIGDLVDSGEENYDKKIEDFIKSIHCKLQKRFEEILKKATTEKITTKKIDFQTQIVISGMIIGNVAQYIHHTFDMDKDSMIELLCQNTIKIIC